MDFCARPNAFFIGADDLVPAFVLLHQEIGALTSIHKVADIVFNRVLSAFFEVRTLLFLCIFILEQLHRVLKWHKEIDRHMWFGQSVYTVLEFVEPLEKRAALACVSDFAALMDLIGAYIAIQDDCDPFFEPVFDCATRFEAIGSIEDRGDIRIDMQKIAMVSGDCLADERAHEVVAVAWEIERFHLHLFLFEPLDQEPRLCGLA